MSKVAVVILNYNGEHFLKQFLPSVIAHTPSAEIIVADNCSTDGSLALLSEHFPEVRTIVLSENHGYAGGYNEALKQIDSDYYLLLNSDVEVGPGWLDPLVRFLDSNPTYAAVQPKILDFKRKEYFEYAGAAGGFIDTLGYPYCRGRIFEVLEKDSGQYDQVTDIHWCSGACFLIRSEVFHNLDGFDADFFAHMEEIDLCWRAINNGCCLAFIPESKVYHVGGGTLNKQNSRKSYLNFRNNISMLIKNLPTSTLLWLYPLRFALDVLAGIKLWIDISFEHFKAVIEAHFYILSKWRSLKGKSQSTGKISTLNSILFEFYMKGTKKFSDLNNTK